MDDSMAQPRAALGSLELPGWKAALGWSSAVVLAVLFLISGIWKVTDAHGWAVRVAQAGIPHALSLPAALIVGILETAGGVFILVPRFRRWGALLIALLLVVFLIYFAVNYNTLRGADCSCFPWLKRVVGPGFFIGDGLMLVAAAIAWMWTKPSSSLRSALLVVVTISIFAVVSYGVVEARQTGAPAPATVTVDGKPYSLQLGKILIYYFDPECMHCFEAAKRMSKMDWGEARVVAVPVRLPQFANQFLTDTGLKAVISTDFEVLRKVFPVLGSPSAVALENGREKAALSNFDNDEPGATLRKLGFAR
jgi:uncharacterized membrane protein YphA (DoxX/SURF4 family)